MSLCWLVLAASLAPARPLFIQTPNLAESGEPSLAPLPLTGLFDYARDNMLDTVPKTTAVRDDRRRARSSRGRQRPEYPGHADLDKLEDLVSDVTPAYIFEPQRINPIKSKRDAEDHWQLRRSNFQEPTMPKRVRFSPWGGKRSGQMILKPNTRAAQVLFSTIPDLGDVFKSDKDIQVDLLNTLEPFKFMALSKRLENVREAMPYKTFFDLPKIFRTGHPYLDLDLKKIGKRKVKFSTWGGKRAPPIIGPLWFPTSQDTKDTALNTVILVRQRDKKSIGDISLVSYA